MEWRKIEESIFKGLMIIASGIVFLSLFCILGVVLVKGVKYLDISMVTQGPRGGFYLGKEGGILNAIVGSLLLAGGASMVSFFLSLPLALYLNVYLKKGALLAELTRFSLDVLWGIPSIVYGAFGFTIMFLFGLKASLLGGIITVALLIFPIMSRAMDEVIQMVPYELYDSAYSLGSTKWEISLRVVFRQTFPGIMTAILIAFGRGIGDAASVIFTAGFSDSVNWSLFRPVATLPLAIFYQLGTPFPEVQARGYSASLVLTAIIMSISILSRLLARRFKGYIIK